MGMNIGLIGLAVGGFGYAIRRRIQQWAHRAERMLLTDLAPIRPEAYTQAHVRLDWQEHLKSYQAQLLDMRAALQTMGHIIPHYKNNPSLFDPATQAHNQVIVQSYEKMAQMCMILEFKTKDLESMLNRTFETASLSMMYPDRCFDRLSSEAYLGREAIQKRIEAYHHHLQQCQRDFSIVTTASLRDDAEHDLSYLHSEKETQKSILVFKDRV